MNITITKCAACGADDPQHYCADCSAELCQECIALVRSRRRPEGFAVCHDDRACLERQESAGAEREGA